MAGLSYPHFWNVNCGLGQRPIRAGRGFVLAEPRVRLPRIARGDLDAGAVPQRGLVDRIAHSARASTAADGEDESAVACTDDHVRHVARAMHVIPPFQYALLALDDQYG